VFGGVVEIRVDTQDKGLVHILTGGGDDHPLGTRLEMCRGGFTAAEAPGRLEDVVDTKVFPRQLTGLALGKDPHPIAVDDDVRAVDLDRALVGPVHRIMAEEIAQHIRRGEVVDGDQIEAVAGLEVTGQQPSDASETVDRNLDAHGSPPRSGMAGEYSR